MNGESKPTLRPLLFVILFGVLVTSIVTAFRSGFVQVALRWPEDQPSAPLLVALLADPDIAVSRPRGVQALAPGGGTGPAQRRSGNQCARHRSCGFSCHHSMVRLRNSASRCASSASKPRSVGS